MILSSTHRTLAATLVCAVLASPWQGRSWVEAANCTNEPVFECAAAASNNTMAYQGCGDGFVTLTVDWGEDKEKLVPSTSLIGEVPAGEWYNQTFAYEEPGVYFVIWQVDVMDATTGEIVSSTYNCKPRNDPLYNVSCQPLRFAVGTDLCEIMEPPYPTIAPTAAPTTSSSPVLPHRWWDIMVLISVVVRVLY
jgi:hypothetical protein